MNTYDAFMDDVDKGRSGYNRSLTTGLPRLDNSIGGNQREIYILIGGNTGTGKTAFVDSAFVINPYNAFKVQYLEANSSDRHRINFRVFYYSFEIAKKKKIAKWVCYLILIHYKMIIDIREVYSKKSTLSQEKYDLIVKCRDYIEAMEEYVHIFDRPTNPYGIFKQVEDYMLANGRVIDVTKIVKGVPLLFKQYIPNDPFEIVQVVVDHIALLRPETDFRTKKEIIDKDSENAITLRNIYGVSRISVCQFNRDLADIDRRRFAELSPQLEDFKNTGNPSEDAEIVMTTFNPLRYNLARYGPNNMDVIRLGGRYRSISILKDRDGTDMKKLDLNFCGECGHFREFPDPFMDDHYIRGKDYKPWK
jgi:replicative DNA helicase